MKPKYTIRKDVKVGIWDNKEIIVRVYADKTCVTEPCVKWVNNNGTLDYRRKTITGKLHAQIMAEIAGDIEIGIDIDDDTLSYDTWAWIDRYGKGF